MPSESVGDMPEAGPRGGRGPSVERLLHAPDLQHDEAQSALAASLSATAPEDACATLDEASVPLFGTAPEPVAEQARALADLLTNHLCLHPERHDHRALLIDHALGRRRAHPLQIAVIGHELGRRAGLRTFVATCGAEPWTAIVGSGGMALVGPGSVDGGPDPGSVRRRCPHQIARAVLARVSAEAPPERSRRAAELLRTLPGCGHRSSD